MNWDKNTSDQIIRMFIIKKLLWSNSKSHLVRRPLTFVNSFESIVIQYGGDKRLMHFQEFEAKAFGNSKMLSGLKVRCLII